MQAQGMFKKKKRLRSVETAFIRKVMQENTQDLPWVHTNEQQTNLQFVCNFLEKLTVPTICGVGTFSEKIKITRVVF